MGTRYGRKAADGTTEYYDSKEELVAAEQQENDEKIINGFLVVGLAIGGLITYSFVTNVFPATPKLLKFAAVLLGAGGTAYIFARIALTVAYIAAIIVGFGILFGIGALIWNVL